MIDIVDAGDRWKRNMGGPVARTVVVRGEDYRPLAWVEEKVPESTNEDENDKD